MPPAAPPGGATGARAATGAPSKPSRVASTAKAIAPAAGSDDDFSDKTGKTGNPLNDTSKHAAIEMGELGLADAESALEAMSSFRLAEGALQRNDPKGAEEYARKAVDGDPTQADYVALLAWIRALGAAPQPIEDAIRTMSRVLIEDPSNERALFYRAKLLVRTNRLPEALNDFNELLLANPNHREAQNEARQLKTKVTS
jgi:tetratricopeptide (TPR) repeat protein